MSTVNVRQRAPGGQRPSSRWAPSAGSQRSPPSCGGARGGSARSMAHDDGRGTDCGAAPGPRLGPPLQRTIWAWHNAQRLSKVTALQVEERTALYVEAVRTTRIIAQLVTPLQPIELLQPRREALLEAAVHAGHLHLRPWVIRRLRYEHFPRSANQSRSRALGRTSTTFSCATRGMTGAPQQKT